ncbi:MAG: hypothetical protein WC757_01870 [Candidatus Paceibacterota bacterium]|jgi:hypothetical protein
MPQKTISLSKHLGVTREKLEQLGVFDSTLGIDTKLFVDPKLLIKSPVKEFKDSRKTIIQYIARLLKIHKQSHKAQRLLDQARNMLAVPEPQGLSIGYGNKTDRGTAISKTLANKILLSASEILAVGIDDEELIEILGLFVEGFGPDSMSDLMVSIVYPDFCLYTERVSMELKVSTKEYTIRGRRYRLPSHPFKDLPIIFIPHSLLVPLPIAVSWDDIVSAAQHNKNLRNDINAIVLPALKEALDDIKNKTEAEKEEFRNGFNSLLRIYRTVEVKAYDLKQDQKGYYALQPFAEKESKLLTVPISAKTQIELVDSVRELIKQFQRSIEDNAGNTLLYRKTETGKLLKDSPHNEDVAQILFYLIADFYCQRANILLSREPNAGLGPVDFSLGTGYESKVLVEIKKSNNKDLENGYKKQIESYQKSEKAFYSFFVVIIVREGTKNPNDLPPQLSSIKKLFEYNKSKNIPTPELVIIDGLVHPSPSKLKAKA